jgi:hypothetical protein
MAGALFVVQHTPNGSQAERRLIHRGKPYRGRSYAVVAAATRTVTWGTAAQAWLVQKPPIVNANPGDFNVSTIGKPVHAPRRILPVIFKVIDRTALFVAYAVFLAVLPVGAISLLTRTV